MPSVKPNGYVPTSRQPSVKPEGWQTNETIQPQPEVKPVPNPLELAPDKQPDPKAAAEYYAYQKNEKARRRALKRQ